MKRGGREQGKKKRRCEDVREDEGTARMWREEKNEEQGSRGKSQSL